MSHSELLYDDGTQSNNNSDCFRSKKNFNLIYSMYVGKKTNTKKKIGLRASIFSDITSVPLMKVD